jgi:HAD superfamily hydrolase (TIGR01509 family)
MDAAIFDWDGTIVDTMPTILRANRLVLADFGIAFDAAIFRAAYSPDWRVMYQRLGVPPEAIEDAGQRWLAHYQADIRLRPFDGAPAAMHRLAATGCRLARVTAGHRGVVETQLAELGLLELMAVRVCGGDDVRSKPHPEPLLRALDELGLADRPRRSVYVGDAPDDMRMARAAGVEGVGIESLLADAGELRAAGAQRVHGSVAEWAATVLDGAER